MKRYLRIGAVLLLFLTVASLREALAGPPYLSFSTDSNGRVFYVQPPYLPERVIDNAGVAGESEEEAALTVSLNSPEDLFVDSRDHLYIVDTANNRVLHLDDRDRIVKTVGEEEGGGQLNGPQGIYVDDSQTMYVADTKNKRIAVFDAEGRFVREYEKPSSPYLPDSYGFEPTKIAVDGRGMMYVATRNGIYGLMLMDSKKGEFHGFFGPNRTPYNFVDDLKRRFFTKDQLAKELKKLPGSITNLSIDSDGFIYTTSVDLKRGQLKKLNYAGQDLLGDRKYGDRSARIGEESLFVDLAVDRFGNISAIDARTGRVYQHDAEGNLIFAFGSKDEGYNKMGLVIYPSSIAVDSSGSIYVLDKLANAIQVFRPTAFGDLVHKASMLYSNGQYEESEKLWSEVLHLNSKYYRAHLGLAKSYYKKEQWKAAMAEFKKARDVTGYSNAYWHVRMIWLQKHFNTIATSLLALAAGWYAATLLQRRIRKKGGRMFGNDHRSI